MKFSFGTVWVYILLILITGVYCISLEFGASWVNDIAKGPFGKDNKFVPGPTEIFIHPDTKSIWEVLALVSLLINMTWGFVRGRNTELHDRHLFPVVCHLSWIALFSFLHLLGFALMIYKYGNWL